MKKIRDQAARRHNVTMHDQHGRAWDAVIDADSMAPCAPLHPKGWSAPFEVPLKYVTVPPKQLARVEIDYTVWLYDAEQARRDYDATQLKEAQRMYGDRAVSAIEDGDAALRMVVGPPPMPVEFVLAARAGNAWALGRSADVPEKARPLLGYLVKHESFAVADVVDFPVADPFAGPDAEVAIPASTEPTEPDPFGATPPRGRRTRQPAGA